MPASLSPHHDLSAPQHTYGTRIRHNITIKPSARLRHSPDPPPRKHRHELPSPPPNTSFNNPPAPIDHLNVPDFPPKGVVLHPDDANSKVFLAIARSFFSVDNRAMTIKDLAEMTVHFGLVCQNVSAASQAITTYIRTHMHRCEVQQDHPLLLKHVLSGTPSDDDLLPALHSRSGGAHCTVVENRKTNFRRGTTVWYLSRVTGAPCPFSRAGIRLCDYTENGKVGMFEDSKEKKRQRDRQRRWDHQEEWCGQKRKRPLRGCARGSDSDSSAAEQPPPKIKLTLRLNLGKVRAAANTASGSARRVIDLSKDSDMSDQDDSMSVDSSSDESSSPPKKVEEEPWSLPPYPRRSISIPCYTPCSEGPYPSYFPSPSMNSFRDPFRRSPSIGSPPPDTDDDEDVNDYHIAMTRQHHPRRYDDDDDDDDFGWDADLDSEGDGETLWESPGPRSPSAPLIHGAEVTVKQEPRDVQGMLEAWEDYDSSLADAKAAEMLAQAASTVLEEAQGKVKVESTDMWDWDSNHGLSSASEWGISPGEQIRVKQEEDLGMDTLFPPGPSSPLSPMSSLSTQFSGFPYSDSPSPHTSYEFEDDAPETARPFATLRPRAKTVPSLSPFFPDKTPIAGSSFSLPPPASIPAPLSPPPLSASHAIASILQSMSMNSPTSLVPPSSSPFNNYSSPPPPCISPHDTRCQPSSSSYPDAVVVRTCQPCTPAITATQIEDISVYQMTLGQHLLLRRIDTDFVNLTPIVLYSGAPQPVHSTIPNATVITQGSSVISGTWVPLAAAQAYVRDHPLQGGLLDLFLSDTLFEHFPSALQDFHRSNAPARMLNQFGRHFNSTLWATQVVAPSPTGWDQRHHHTHHHGAEVLPVSAPFALSAALSPAGGDEKETPLSVTEQEIFQELCVIPDWEKDGSASPPASMVDAPAPLSESPVEARSLVPETVGSSSASMHVAPRSPEVSAAQLVPPSLTPISIPATNVAPPPPPTDTVPGRPDRPLRRSKRVADAMAQSQTRSRRGSSRNSLS